MEDELLIAQHILARSQEHPIKMHRRADILSASHPANLELCLRTHCDSAGFPVLKQIISFNLENQKLLEFLPEWMYFRMTFEMKKNPGSRQHARRGQRGMKLGSTRGVPQRSPRQGAPLEIRAPYQDRVRDLELEATKLRQQLQDMELKNSLLDYYQELFEGSPVGSVVLDEMGFIHDTNAHLRLMLAPDSKRHLDGPFARFVAKANLAGFLSHLRRAKTSSQAVSTDMVLQTTEGRRVPVEILSVPMLDDRPVMRFRTMVLDISHRDVVKEELLKTQHDLQALVDTSQGMFWESDATTQDVTYMSRSAQDVLGYEPKAWYQPGFWHDHIDAEDRERVSTAFARLARFGVGHEQEERPEATKDLPRENQQSHSLPFDPAKSVVLEFRMISADRRLVWMHSTITVRNIRGKARFFGVGVDITERKLAEQHLQRAHAELESRVIERTAELRETVAQLETFSYSLSHDMRAPLRAMHGFSEMLVARLGDKPVERDMLQRIMSSVRRLDRLIQDVLHYSKVTRSAIDLKPVDLEKLMENTIRDYPSLQHPGAEIQVDRPLLPVLGHEAFLTQCFSNLLSNAFKFVRPGEKPVVHIHTECIDSQVRVWVEDHGIGIAPEHQKQVFSIFQRLHHAPNLYEGTGLGLAIVQKAVERMGGRVGVESALGEGSRFWFQLQAANSASH